MERRTWRDIQIYSDGILGFLEEYSNRLVAIIKKEMSKLGFNEDDVAVSINESYITWWYNGNLPIQFITDDYYIVALFKKASSMFYEYDVECEYGSMHLWHCNFLEDDINDEIFALLEMTDKEFEVWRRLQ